MTKHTPGPWTIMEPRKAGGALGDYGDRGIEAAGVAIAEAWEHCPTRGDPDGTRVDALANAQLIAAAPELLAALEDMLACMNGKKSDGTLQKRARAAIAKATGEKS